MIRNLGSTALLLIVALSLFACGDSGTEPPPSDVHYDTQIEAPLVAGSLFGPTYEEPIPVTSGDYWPPDVDYNDALQRFQAASAAEGSGFDGEVAGFRVAPPVVISSEKDKLDSCPGARIELIEELQFKYLPPGTSLGGPQYAWVCPDGSRSVMAQLFETKRGWFNVEFATEKPTISHSAPSRVVREVEINGMPGVVIEPLIPEGIGQSHVGVVTKNGFIRVTALDLPVTELLKTIEGISCDVC